MPLDAAATAAAVHDELVRGDPAVLGDPAAVRARVRAAFPVTSESTVAEITRRVLDRARGLGPLEPMLADPEVTEVMVNGPGPVWIERRGRLERTDVSLDHDLISLIVERIVAPLGRRVDRTAPLVDARLPDGSRVNVIVPPLAVDGPCVTIRRFGARRFDLAELCGPGVDELLRWAVSARANLVVSGGAGAGKTTVLNALAAALPDGERIVTIEDAAELQLPAPHVVRLEARPASADGLGEVTIRDLVRNALRMRPDRIIVGEVRGAEALDMVQAMNTGHEGSLTTCHANGPEDALRRLETMVSWSDAALPLTAVRDHLGAAIDLVVHVARSAGGRRGVVGVAEVLPEDLGTVRVRELADRAGLHALPRRPRRDPDAPAPDPVWCDQ